ncbi:T6SS immunity protein Tdi1 domain-containing protein [Microbacterium sp. ZW T5_56]|uniref:T6SS immunity protein Tdi1 domain-containing protein n=1 Tax=Microbacterium sp. ZW T5_56 TaxID=3378081 RepID=UPI003854124A
MATFTTYRAAAPVPEQTLASLAAWQGFPTELVTLWREWGTGFIGEDGYVRIIDPAKYQPYLSEWFTDTQGAIPFLATGMGDLFVWQPDGTPGGVIRHVLYRIGEIRNIAPQFETLFSFLEDPRYLDTWLQRGDYTAGIARLGQPELYEAFFYAPFLPLGGTPHPSHLNRGDLAVSLSVFTQMMGRASLIPGQAPG